MDLQQTIQLLRTEIGLTQTELGEAVHVSFSTVNRWKRRGKKIFARIIKKSSLLTVVLLLLTTITMHAYATASESAGLEVRVALFPLGTFQYYDEAGNPAGYNVDYLNEIGKHTHWVYEYVACEDFQDACAKLQSNEVDIVAPAQLKEFLEAEFLYSTYTMATEFGAVYVLNNEESRDIAYENFDAMSDFTYSAVLYNSSSWTTYFIDEYAKTNQIDIKNIIYYDSMSEVLEALRNGTVDAAITNILFAADDLKLLARFNPQQSYYLLDDDAKELCRQLNDAMTYMLISNPSYQSELSSQYFPIYSGTEFTYAEQQYLDELPEIIVGYQANQSPLSYTDENGYFAGIVRDIMDKISEFTGIQMKYTAISAADVGDQYLKDKRINVLASVGNNSLIVSENKYLLSAPYIDSDIVFVTNEDYTFTTNSNCKLAMVEGISISETIIKALYPNFDIRTYPSLDECFQAVKSGETDLLADDRYVINILLAKPLYGSLNVSPFQALTDQLSIGVIVNSDTNDEVNTLLSDDRFISVIDKAINQLSVDDLNNIIITNTSNTRYQMTTGDTLYQYRWALCCYCLYF